MNDQLEKWTGINYQAEWIKYFIITLYTDWSGIQGLIL